MAAEKISRTDTTFTRRLNGYDKEEVDYYIESLSEAYQTAYGEYKSACDKYNKLLEDYNTLDKEREQGKSNAEVLAKTLHIQEMLGQLKSVGNLKRLYLAREDETGAIAMTMHQDGAAEYVPDGELAADLRRSLREVTAVMGSKIYHTDHGSVYTMFWPVVDKNNNPIGAVCMEFDVESIYRSSNWAAVYSLALSGALIVLIPIIAYLSLNRATEPFYKKLAYTDALTGYENRMAFEQRLRECGDLAEQGKSITLIIFDLNNLKTVNDTLGHKQGDAYLKNTADIISQNLHGHGNLYRIGGDEFAAVLVGAEEKELQGIMDSLREEKRPALKTKPFSVACGAATFKKGVDKSLRDVFGRADDAMYEDKKKQKALSLQ